MAEPEAAEPAAAGERPGLTIVRGSAQDDEARDRFVRAHPDGTFFHLSGWRRAIENLYGHEPIELVARRGGELVGVLPMMLCQRLRGGRHLVSQPYAVYGGPVAEDRETVLALVDEARAVGQALRVGNVELRCLHDPLLDVPRSELYWTFLRDLPADPDEVLARMPKKARADARKARDKYGLELGEGRWYVDDLARLFLANKHGLGSPALPRRHFQELIRHFGDDVFVHVVRQSRRPLSAVMSIAFRDTLIAYYAGAEPGADRSYKASNYMYLALQEWAVRRGFRRFDFCRSRADSGAFAFKCHQGFVPQPLHYRFLLVRDRRVPAFTPSNPRTRILQAAWSRLPRWLVRRVSAGLAPYLP
ncbi:MAG: FemAB family XrtA/PEP-CTERM system-associated protein [Planctomycetota bacterium]